MENYIASGLIRNIEKWAPSKNDTMARAVFFQRLSQNPSINTLTLQTYNDESWNAKYLTENESFSFDWIDAVPDIGWNWSKLSRMHPPIHIIRKYSRAPWDWVQVSLSNGITFKDMADNRDLPWVVEEVMFREISQDEEIEYLRVYMNRYDFYAWVDHSGRVTWDLFKKNMDLPWSLYHIKPVVTDDSDMQLIASTQPQAWNWIELSKSVPIDIILKHKDLQWWNWQVVSMHPYLEYEHVVEHPDVHWDYSYVPSEEFSEKLARKWIAASKIKRAFKRAMSNPNYKRCRDRLLEEWGEYEAEHNVA